MEDQYGQLWIGTSAGLSKFDRFTERFTQYRHDMNNPHSLSHNEVWAIYEDSYSQGKTLWIGTRAGGLNKFDRKNEQFVRYIRDFDDPFSLNNPAILSIYQDRAGNLWFGTYSGGLNKFNRETEQFTFFTERDGLANNMIFGILEDKKGNLWLSTNKGISKFNPSKKSFRNYDVYDGLQANEFNPGAYCLRRDGEMFFGGVNGINSFFPDSVKDNTYLPPVVITSFSIFDTPNPQILNRAIFKNEPVRLSYRENFITIEFAALDYSNPRKNHYAYMLEGVNEGWIDCGTRRFASFTNLEPGDYLFRVKGSNNDGLWNQEGTFIRIIITPPFWKTWWFYLIAGAVVVVTIISLHGYRLRHKIKRLMELEQVRTQENERVRAKAAHDFHDELGHRLTKINLFSELAKRNVSNSSAEIVDYLNRIGETAKGLSGGMRDFIWTLDPEKDTLYEVAIRLKDFGDELFDKSGIAFRLEGLSREMENVRLSMDWRRHITLIFKEAMNNVLKHSRGQNATLRVKLERNYLVITLEDDGKGLPESLISESQHGSIEIDSPGNGLNNMQFRAQKIQGGINFLTNGSKGTIVKFSGEIPHIGN
jgi:signal transduction histidine kinase/streptogramin lyase